MSFRQYKTLKSLDIFIVPQSQLGAAYDYVPL
jgi:hypothetical protein